MNPIVEAARVAADSNLIGVAIGVAGTTIVGWLGFRNTRAATKATTDAALTGMREQIEADRRSRIWEKQAAAYSDAIGVVRARMALRQGMMRQMLTGTKPEETTLLADWATVTARLIAYASPGVLDALSATVRATDDFQAAITLWAAAMEQAHLMAADGLPTSGTASERDAASKALIEANRLDDVLVDVIRDELHAGTDRPPALPVPLAKPAPEHQK